MTLKTASLSRKALILVDLQLDFCPGGNLAVPEGDCVIPLANQLQPHFDVVVATQDWHPADHMSFAANHAGKNIGDVIQVHGISQVLWPSHCVQNSKGAEFHPLLEVEHVKRVFHKGTDRFVDSYSAFFDNEHLRATGLAAYLQDQGIQDVYIMGLATDYCVKFSCLDAVKLGFNVYMIEDACRGVELAKGDIAHAIQEMQAAGVKLITVNTILSRFSA